MEQDVIIVGAGFVGSSLAIALSGQGLRVSLIESRPLESADAGPRDERAIALAQASRRVFQSLGLWQSLEHSAAPIERIHISDRGHFGAARLEAAEEGVEALGYVVPAYALGQCLTSDLRSCSDISVVAPATVSRVELNANGARIDLEGPNGSMSRNCRLLVAADGGNSDIRRQLGFEVTRDSYGQVAVTTTVTVSRALPGTAFERFSETGPVALLPFGEDRYGVVWTVEHDRADEVMSWDDATFLARLQDTFGYRAGWFRSVAGRSTYPLSMTQTSVPASDRVVLAGAAANALHPIAGQGFNLGLRDVATLAEVVVAAAREAGDCGAAGVIERYLEGRARDHRFVTLFTDGLARLFVNPARPVVDVRNLGLLALDILPTLRHALCRRTMGLSGQVPQLVRGVVSGR